MIELSVVIPCYNEGENLKTILQNIKKHIHNEYLEVIIVNNGSTDNSIEILNNFKFNNFKILNLKENKGYGNGIINGLKIAKGEILAWTHGDLQCEFNDVITAYDLYNFNNKNNIVIKGKRQKRSFSDELLTLGMQIISSVILDVKLNDINAQPKLFNKKFFKLLESYNPPLDFSLDLFLLFLALKKNYKIIDFPINFKDRIHGEAKGGGGNLLNKFKIIYRTLKYIFNLKKNYIIKNDNYKT